jgi:hypothetical protein
MSELLQRLRISESKRWVPAALMAGIITIALLVAPGRDRHEQQLAPGRTHANLLPQKPSWTPEYGAQPLRFEAIEGGGDVRFVARARGLTVALTKTGATLLVSHPNTATAGLIHAEPHRKVPGETTTAVVHLGFAGSDLETRLVGLEELPGSTNYFLGRDPTKWRTDVVSYAQVEYEAVYPGVDVVYYGAPQLEYDLIVDPDHDPGVIVMRFAGATDLRISDRGDLRLHTPRGELVQYAPVVYQEIEGERTLVEGRYELRGEDRVGLRIGPYDVGRPLVIDPVLSLSSYVGGNGGGTPNDMAVDPNGNVYIVGNAGGGFFPTTHGAFQTTNPGFSPAYVTKFGPDGMLIYSTYLGGSDADPGTSIVIDDTGNAYVTGDSYSHDFPTTVGAFQEGFGGGLTDAFVTKLSADGAALVFSSLLGGMGDDYALGLGIDASGAVYVSGSTVSSDIPTSAGAYQSTLAGASDRFVTKLSADGAELAYSTLLGGSEDDGRGFHGNMLAVDEAGFAYVTGQVESSDFPTTSGAVQTSFGGGPSDAFVTKLSTDGSAVVYSTLLGGAGNDLANVIAVEESGDTYLTGFTQSTDFPTSNPIFGTLRGTTDAFVAALTSDGASLRFSTFLGGSLGSDEGLDIAVGPEGHIYVAGGTASRDFPTVNPFQAECVRSEHIDCEDAFIAQLSPGGGALVHSSFLGGSGSDHADGVGVDGAGNMYVSGTTFSPDLPLVGTQQRIAGNTFVAFVENSERSAATIAPTAHDFGESPVGVGTAPQELALRNVSSVPLRLDSVMVEGDHPDDFTVTDSCDAASVTGGSTCVVAVRFLPTGRGRRTGTVTFETGATNGPHSVSLQGHGIVSYSLGAEPAAATASAGDTATYALTVTPLGQVDETVSLNCLSPHASIACSIAPDVVTLSATSVTTTLRVATSGPATASHVSVRRRLTRLRPHRLSLVAGTLLLVLLSAVGSRAAGKAGAPTFRAAATLLLLHGAVLVACGESAEEGPIEPPPGSQTPPGAYTIRVQATSPSVFESATVRLIVR